MTHTTSINPNPTQAKYDALLADLRTHTAKAVGYPDTRSFLITVKDEAGETMGQLWGEVRWHVFHLDIIVVDEAAQEKGVGSELMTAAETLARQEGCFLMWLDTYAFQAREFYEKHGFEVFSSFEGSPPHYPHWFMKKALGVPKAESAS
ncbi:MAG: GNAT family N-acetyltransferase [Maricaulaceae bacterium]